MSATALPAVYGIFDHPDLVAVYKQLAAEAPSSKASITNIDAHESEEVLTTQELVARAAQVAAGLREAAGAQAGSIVVLQVENKNEVIIAFWGCVIVGAVAVVLPVPPTYAESNAPLSKLLNANDLFENPIVITSAHLTTDVSSVLQDNTNIFSVSALGEHAPTTHFHEPKPSDLCLMSLTSGSTGTPKSVMHTHSTVMAGVRGKRAGFPLKDFERTLSWVPLDHVAGLVEYHVLPLLCGFDQVHVDAQCMAVPLTFLRLASKRKITFTFAPNAFIGMLHAAVRGAPEGELAGVDLSQLHCIVSGGEATVIDSAKAFLTCLGELGLPDDCIVPGFGMTETCAGCIFNTDFPRVDKGKKFASMGHCVPGMVIRTVDADGVVTAAGVVGELQLSGPILFTGYYKNEKANRESFVEEAGVRWFKTGDEGYIMDDGTLQLTGRTKDTININGITYFCHEIEAAVERLNFISRGVAISTRVAGANTEELIVFFVPKEDAHAAMSVPKMGSAVAAECVKQFGVSCAEVVPLTEDQVPKSSLGKVIRKMMEKFYELGEYSEIVAAFKMAGDAERAARPMIKPVSEEEETIIEIWSRVLEIPSSELSTQDNFFDMGGTSLHVLAIKKFVDAAFATDMAITHVYKCPTVAALAAWVQRAKAGEVEAYDPIVPMQLSGSGTPLFFVHPGVGDVLVFTDLAKSFVDERPFYGIRAPGFEPGEPVGFESMAAMATTYADAIQRTQPEGPYVLAGYSYGGVVAYETARILEQRGGQVDFMAMLNIPPHIQERMKQLHWKEGLLNLGWFLDIVHPGADREECSRLLDEITTDEKWLQPEGCRERAYQLVIDRAPEKRLSELNLNAFKLGKWLQIAQQMVHCGLDYTPSGSLAVLDCFYAKPLFHTMDEWVASLKDWEEFTRNDGGRRNGFTRVPGEHYTLMDPEHIDGFQKIFREQLAFREHQANELRAGRAIATEGDVARGPYYGIKMADEEGWQPEKQHAVFM
jgi:acyl-CoA synthetase (AMP-forming)/AMP-acid ligase II/thioesterase domain-containing protein